MVAIMSLSRIPSSVVSIGVCGIVVAGGGLALDVAILGSGASGGELDNFYRTLAVVTIPLNLCLAIGSRGALLSRQWSRRCMLLWSGMALLYAVGRLVLTFTWAAPTATAMSRAALAGQPPSEFGPEFSGMMVALVGMLICILTSILPVFTLVVLTRRHVRDFFEFTPPRQ